MTAFVLKMGRHWNRTAIRWSLQRLRHRGKPVSFSRRTGLDLYAFGDSPMVSSTRDFHLITWHIGQGDHEQILELVRKSSDEFQLPPGLGQGLLIIHHRVTSRIEIHLGWDCLIPVHFARRGRSLLVAPEIKAIPDVSDRNRIKRLDYGSTLKFDPSTKQIQVAAIPWKWHPLPLTDLSYEACQQEISRLLEESVNDLKNTHRGRLPIALSGGLDSSVVAWLVSRAGIDCEAYTVWFDSGSGPLPPDLVGARLTARACGIPLVELRIGSEHIEALARETVFYVETSHWREVETGSYVLRLAIELQSRGHSSLLTGLAADGTFAGMVFRRQLGARFQEEMIVNRRHRVVMGSLNRTLGIQLLDIFRYKPLSDFTLRLPHAYLVEEIDGKLCGKKILRDMYAGTFESPLVSLPKDFPYNTAGSEALYQNNWGPRSEREARYTEWLEELLEIPRFRRRFPFLPFLGVPMMKGRAK